MSTKFNVYYSTTPNGPWILANTTPIDRDPNGNEYTITGLRYGVVYYVTVIGGKLNNQGEFVPLVSQSIGPRQAGISGVNSDYKPSIYVRTWLPEITDEEALAHQFTQTAPIVQEQVASNATYLSTGTTMNVTLASPPTDGSLLVLTVSSADLTTQSNNIANVTQSGATWAKAVNSYDSGSWCSDSWSYDLEIWYTTALSGASQTISISLLYSSVYIRGIVAEYSGIQSGVLDQAAYKWRTQGIVRSTGITAETTQSNELWVGAITSDNSPLPITAEYSNGFSEVGQVSSHSRDGLIMMDKVVYGTTVANCDVTLDSSKRGLGVIATFKK